MVYLTVILNEIAEKSYAVSIKAGRKSALLIFQRCKADGLRGDGGQEADDRREAGKPGVDGYALPAA